MPQKDWLILSIFTFLITVVWITLEIFHTYTASTVSGVDEKLMQPLTPSFDHQTIIKLVEEN
jgi:hypothetical protein